MSFVCLCAYEVQKSQEANVVGFPFQVCINLSALVVLASYEWCLLKKKYAKRWPLKFDKKGAIIGTSAHKVCMT